MGSAARRQREREELRSRILEAARELFVTAGYDAVTMRKIAERIEYSPTAIYFHFRDKDALLRELCTLDFLALAHAFDRLRRIPHPVERLRRLGEAYVRFALEHPNQYRLMFMTPHPHLGEPEEIPIGNPEQDSYAFLRVTVTEAIERKLLGPHCTDPDLVAQALWSAVHGIVSLFITKEQQQQSPNAWIEWQPVRKTARFLVDAMIRGLTARGG